MMKQAVIDSNVLVAIVDSRDNWHGKALSLLVIQNSGHIETLRQNKQVSIIEFDFG
jgi:predicted nucleic acid-binding protein